jgi:sucrose-6-phosphate hydrolase SacC (GH32 family)
LDSPISPGNRSIQEAVDMQRKNGAAKASHPEMYNEKYRPQLHFSARENWLNDPNGLVWHDGLFHLFYQYNPTGNDWGNMHWGHAVSRNLMNWDMRPIALHAEPLGLGYPFSGCAVHDRENTSGLGSNGAGPLVVLYTNCTTDGIQSQSLAYSLDEPDRVAADISIRKTAWSTQRRLGMPGPVPTAIPRRRDEMGDRRQRLQGELASCGVSAVFRRRF